jgi:hypothetical protein
VTQDIATVAPSDAGLAILPDDWWPCGRMRVGYIHGYDRPDPLVRSAAIKAISYRIHTDRAGVDPRVLSMQTVDGGTMQLATPGLSMWVTAIPEVDAVLKDHRWAAVGIA